ncbi:MAG: pre-16S rRNA-processing nuclease YqgF [Cyanobacteriota bacterium]|nr:pre-16S rRNA-processing nuclease YqgF [Cyanobacteriota bacterium]
MILGFDPGRDKCGVAIIGKDNTLHYHQVLLASEVTNTITALCRQFGIERVVIGDQTTSKLWTEKLKEILPASVAIATVNERNSSLEARDRYWQMYPPRGIFRLIPVTMRMPPRPIDDIVAILLIERYLKSKA